MNKHRSAKPALWILACVVLNALVINLASAQPPSDDGFITITPDNADQIELGYVFPDVCSDYQPSGNLIVIAKDGIYDVFTGKERVDNKGFRGTFSPDGLYFWYSEGTIVDTQSGDQFPVGFGNFSDDSKYAASVNGVYELSTKKKLFATPDVGWFSHDSRYVAIGGDALYELKTGKKRYPLAQGLVSFSPDSQYFAVWGTATGAVYDTTTGKPIITTQGLTPTFSPDSQYVAISGDGVYDLKT